MFLYRISIIVLAVLYFISLIYKQNWKSVMENFVLLCIEFKVMQIVIQEICCHQLQIVGFSLLG